MKRCLLWGAVGVTGLAAVLLLCSLLGTALGGGGSFAFGGAVGVLRLELDPILHAEDFVKLIERARRADHLKAIVLRIDSPGGAVGASQEIHAALKRLNADKPLIASMGNVAASGGYYAAVAARKIFALPGTITASIGVRMSHVDASGLLQWLQLKPETLKSGAMKDTGDMHRALRPDERAFLEALLHTMHHQFKQAVAEGRGLSLDTLDPIADGRVMTGEEAVQQHLVDQLGDLHDAIAAAGELAGLTRDPKVYEIKDDDSWLSRLGSKDADALVHWASTHVMAEPVIGYMWRP